MGQRFTLGTEFLLAHISASSTSDKCSCSASIILKPYTHKHSHTHTHTHTHTPALLSHLLTLKFPGSPTSGKTKQPFMCLLCSVILSPNFSPQSHLLRFHT